MSEAVLEALEKEKAKRERGTGSITRAKYKNKDGVWVESPNYMIRYRAGGKLISESTGFTSKMKAEKLLQKRLGEAALGMVPAQTLKRLKYEEIRDTLKADYEIKGRTTLVTKADGSKVIYGIEHLDGFFAGMSVSSITTARLREFIKKRQGEGAADGKINRDLALLRRMLNLARREGKIHNVPYFPMLKDADPRQGFLIPQQFERLRAAMPEHLHPIVTFLYFTGCRVGAAKKVQWSQLVFQGDKVEMRLEAKQVKNRTALTLPLPGDLAKMLRKQFRKAGPVFDATNLREAFRAAAVKVGLGAWRDPKNHDKGYDGLTPHDFRRSGVRNLIRSGVPETTAMKISGHKTRAIFDRYNIVDSSDLHDAMGKVEKFVLSLCKVASSEETENSQLAEK